MTLSMKQKKNQGHENRLLAVKKEGVGEGRSGSLGLTDANWYI